jgi:hypothetical protein
MISVIRLVEGPPTLPPDSTVTVGRSMLTIPVGTGHIVPANWYFPSEPQSPTRLLYLQHGFLASAPLYSYTAAVLAQQTNSIVVAPSLTSNLFAGDAAWLGEMALQRAVADLFIGERASLTASATLAAGSSVTLPRRFVLAGHSMGGGLVAGAAGFCVDNGAVPDLAGVMLFDAVSLNNALPTAMEKLTGADSRPVLLITEPLHFWNQLGDVSRYLVHARPNQFVGISLVGGSHIDAMQSGNVLIQKAAQLFTGFSLPHNIEAIQTISAGWINDMFAGTRHGVYGAPGQPIQIPTSAGTATAFVLPAPPNRTSPMSILLQTIFDAAPRAFFSYAPRLRASRRDAVVPRDQTRPGR